MPDPDRTFRIVERAANMGGCSQTHHAHLCRDAERVLAALTPPTEPLCCLFAPDGLPCPIHKPGFTSTPAPDDAIAALREEKAFDYPPMVKHPFTCGECSWGRNPENFSILEYEKHTDTSHDKKT